MKHLKTYNKLFESIEDLDYDLIQEIKDILLPFYDMSMYIRCDYIHNGGIAISISTSKEKTFDINEYKDDIDALLSYMKENKWGIYEFKVGTITKLENWKGVYLAPDTQEILSYINGPIQYDKVEKPIFWITAEFRKIVYTKVKSIKESVKSESSEDLKYSDRDMTNKYYCQLGWVRYTNVHKDSYIDIEKYFDITWDHLGWILEDLVNKCNLYYRCSVADSVGLQPGAEDYGEFGIPADYINIDLVPVSEKTNSYNQCKKILLNNKNILKDIEDKLNENYPWLTIMNDDLFVPVRQTELDKYNLFTTSSQITLKIKRK